MLYHDHAQSLYTSCSACTGVLRKNTETDILVYGGNWVKIYKVQNDLIVTRWHSEICLASGSYDEQNRISTMSSVS